MRIYLVIVLCAALLFVGCKSNQPAAADSPGEAVRLYFAASQRRDIPAMKSLLSKESLALIEESARLQKTTADELLRREASVRIQKAPETRNERIEGDTATVEIKNETTGAFDMTMPLVREDGSWKLARDQFVREAVRRANEEINRKLANSANSTTNAAPNANKPANK